MTDGTPEFSADLLQGADEIARFLYGSPSSRRKVYHLASTSHIPIFRLGSMLCARKSVLLDWIKTQERRHANDNRCGPHHSVKAGNG